MSIEWLKEVFPEDIELLVIEMEEEIKDFEYVSREIVSESDSESEYIFTRQRIKCCFIQKIVLLILETMLYYNKSFA